MKSTAHFLLALFILALSTYIACARDPGPLQDYCVAVDEPEHGVYVNGKFCKDPEKVTSDDFICKGLNIPADTNNVFGRNVTIINVDTCPGLNTMGIQKSRLDLAPGGVNPLHIHPRGTEFLTVMKGRMYTGFMASTRNQSIRFFPMVLEEGDSMIVPQGMPHLEVNIGKGHAYSISAFSSQKAGGISLGSSMFKSSPLLDPLILSKSLLVDDEIIKKIQKRFAALVP